MVGFFGVLLMVGRCVDVDVPGLVCVHICPDMVEDQVDVKRIVFPEDFSDKDALNDFGTCVNDWIGAVYLGIDGYFNEENMDQYVSNFVYEEDEAQVVVNRVKFQGLVNPMIINEVSEAMKQLDITTIFSVWGFENACITWGVDEHEYYFGGDNNYHVIQNEKNRYLLSNKNAHDKKIKNVIYLLFKLFLQQFLDLQDI